MNIKRSRQKHANVTIKQPPLNYLSVAEASEYIGISERNLRSLIALRKLKVVRLGKRILLRIKDLDLYMESLVR